MDPWWYVGMCVSVLLVLQLALMAAVPSAMAALDGHRGAPAVAENGLAFLWNQSLAPENRVRLGVPECVTGPGDRLVGVSSICMCTFTSGG